ncbi:hypothetical protein BDV93DRAFT_566180 [Ceratobasidium sp. AG-I]|nr:hypothetical protein BDV93DRAFT_566180 [Ceratobasidium sp. AG-I]
MERGGTTILNSNSSGTALNVPFAVNLQGGASMFIAGTATVHPLRLMDLRDFESPAFLRIPTNLCEGVDRICDPKDRTRPVSAVTFCHWRSHFEHFVLSVHSTTPFGFSAPLSTNDTPLHSCHTRPSNTTLHSPCRHGLPNPIATQFTSLRTPPVFFFCWRAQTLPIPPHRASLGWAPALIRIVMLGHMRSLRGPTGS